VNVENADMPGLPGFDMSAMRLSYYDEGIVEAVHADEVVTNEYILRV